MARKKLPHLPLGAQFSSEQLLGLTLARLEQLQNDLWNLIEAYEAKIKVSKQYVVQLTYDLDRDDAMRLMKQVQSEFQRRQHGQSA